MIIRVIMGIMSLLIVSAFASSPKALADEAVQLKYSQAEIEDKWQVRIQSFLEKDVIPLIDLLSFLPRKNIIFRSTSTVKPICVTKRLMPDGSWVRIQFFSLNE